MRGTFEQKIDAKGRVVIPAKYRDVFGGLANITIFDQGCLWVGPNSSFESQWEEELSKRGQLTEAENNRRRVLLRNSTDVPVDGQGRMLVNERQRQHAGIELDQPVTIIGVGGYLEIWNTERLMQVTASAEALIRGSEAFE
jgi:MraZ protein